MGLFYWLWFHGQGEFLPLVPLPYTLYLEALTLYILLGLFYQILFTELLIWLILVPILVFKFDFSRTLSLCWFSLPCPILTSLFNLTLCIILESCSNIFVLHWLIYTLKIFFWILCLRFYIIHLLLFVFLFYSPATAPWSSPPSPSLLFTLPTPQSPLLLSPSKKGHVSYEYQ